MTLEPVRVMGAGVVIMLYVIEVYIRITNIQTSGALTSVWYIRYTFNHVITSTITIQTVSTPIHYHKCTCNVHLNMEMRLQSCGHDI